MAGHRIGPFDVESVLAAHPAVTEAAIVAAPDELRGEVVEAYVVLTRGAQGTPALSPNHSRWSSGDSRRMPILARSTSYRNCRKHRAARASGSSGVSRAGIPPPEVPAKSPASGHCGIESGRRPRRALTVPGSLPGRAVTNGRREWGSSLGQPARIR